MNHIYRSIWNEALCAWVAVSEITKGQGKRASNRRKHAMTASPLKDWQSFPLLVTGLLLCSSTALALPTGDQLVAGQASVSNPAANVMQINQTSQKAAINWQDFSIKQNEAVNINQPNAQAALLNRVVGQDASQIQGQLNANGQVYLVNPNGVIFGKTAQVDVGGLIATTHDIKNSDFMNGKNHFTQNGATGTVENHGIINTPNGGIVALIGEKVTNTGTINTPKGTTALAAGKTVDLDFQGNGLVEVKVTEAALNAQITNKGAIQADGGRVVLSAKAANNLIDTVINQDGIIKARGLIERNGEIILDGGDNGAVKVSGTLNTNNTNQGLDSSGSSNPDLNTGGNITVKGAAIQLVNGANVTASGNTGGGVITIGDKQTTQQTTIAQGATVSANTLDSGTAGTIKLLANMDNGLVKVDGQLDASAPKNGDGGFIDTSAAHVNVADTAKISTLAANGNTGTWLIDPKDYSIAASGGDITGAVLSANLGSTSVIIASIAGANGVNGDVNVNDAVSWSANKLTLNAQRNININANLNGSGTAKLALQYGQASAGGGANDSYFINGAKVNLSAGANFSTKKGSTGAVKNYTVITSLGTEGSTTTTDLQGMDGNVAGNYALGADINASVTSSWNSGAGFLPVGQSGFQFLHEFTGSFDGLGHTITGLTINRPMPPTINYSNYVGLFGVISNASIRNVGMLGGNILGYQSVGGLVGYNSQSTINNVYATSSVSGTNNVGGLVGQNIIGTISNAYAAGSVIGIRNIGGLVGYNNNGGGGAINNAYATGSVNGTNNVGGLVGYNFFGVINNTYATGIVNGSNGVGGLVGVNGISSTYGTKGANPTNSFWNTQTTGQSTSAGGTGINTAQMKQLSTFTNWSISNAGGSSAVWRIYEGQSTPLLRSFLIPLNVSADNLSITYNAQAYTGSLSNPVYSVAGAGSSGHLFNLNAPYVNAVNVGTYRPPALYSDQQGYDIRQTNSILTINPATITTPSPVTTPITVTQEQPVSISDALESNNKAESIGQYFVSKGIDVGVSATIGAISSVFFELSSQETLVKFLNPDQMFQFRNAMKNVLSNEDTILKIGLDSAWGITKGLGVDLFVGMFVDEFKSAHPNLTVWDSAGLDVVVSALKNAAMAKSSGPGFALAFQIGFTMDMAALAAEQSIKALEKAVELNAAEDMMHQSSIKLAIQSIAAKNTANDIFKQIATLRNTSSLEVTNEIVEKMIAKAKNLISIGNDGLETLAIEYLDYYRKKATENEVGMQDSLSYASGLVANAIITDPYKNCTKEDVKEVVLTALKIKDIINNAGTADLVAFSKESRTTETGKLVYKLLNDVPFTAFSYKDNQVKTERLIMLKAFAEQFTNIQSGGWGSDMSGADFENYLYKNM